MPYANNIGADQPAHLLSLITAPLLFAAYPLNAIYGYWGYLLTVSSDLANFHKQVAQRVTP